MCCICEVMLCNFGVGVRCTHTFLHTWIGVAQSLRARVVNLHCCIALLVFAQCLFWFFNGMMRFVNLMVE